MRVRVWVWVRRCFLGGEFFRHFGPDRETAGLCVVGAVVGDGEAFGSPIRVKVAEELAGEVDELGVVGGGGG